jgi:hypothetical protein
MKEVAAVYRIKGLGVKTNAELVQCAIKCGLIAP